MRAIVFLLAVALLAGCASTKTTPPTNTTTTPTAGGSGTNGTGAATQLATDSHDFSTGAASGTPAGMAASKAFKIPPGTTKINLTVTFTPGPAPAGVATGVTVKVAGATCTLPDGPVTATVKCVGKEASVTAGDSKIDYSGAGPVTASVTVSGS